MRDRNAIIFAGILLMSILSLMPMASGESRELLPPPPENVNAIAKDQMIRLEWDPPAGMTGSDLDGYTIYRGTSQGSVDNFLASLGPFDNFLEDEGLTNGKPYYYSVISINESGSSDPSTPVSAIPRGPASKPYNFTVDYGSNVAYLSWEAPEDENGSPLEFYSVFKGPRDTQMDTRINVSMDTEYTDNGLINGEDYFYQVCAVTAAGDGRKTSVKSVTPRTVPTAPYNLTSTMGDSTVILLWNYSLDDGGTSITGHRIYQGTSLETLERVASIGFTNTHTLTDLENGVEYYFSVSAFNTEGESGLASATMETPLGPPGQPLNMTLQPGNAEVTVSWEEPEFDGGTDIVGYNVYMNRHGEEMALAGDAGDALSYTVDNLENGQIHYFQVKAYNSIGEGIGSVTDMIRPEPLPRSPENFRLIDMEGEVKLLWSRPQYTGEYPYDEVLIYRGTSEDDLDFYTNISYIYSQFYDTDVEVGTTYYYKLTSTSRIGEGLPTTTMVGRPYSRPSTPGSFNGEAGTGTAYLTWDIPDFFGGRVIEGYKIHRGTQENEMTVVATLSAMKTFYNDTTLTDGVTYYYRISAFNAELESNTTAVIQIKPTGPPREPRDPSVVLDPKNKTAEITWNEPSSDGGLEISAYRVYRGPERDNVTLIGEASTDLSYVDDTVEEGTDYYYRISGVNSEGEGLKSVVIYLQVPLDDSEEDDSGGSIVLWIVIISVVLVLIAVIIIIAVVQSNNKKKREAKEDEDVPQLEESESEREERLIRERRQMMSQFTDVSISTIDAHATDHDQHNLSYEDLYGNSSETTETTPDQSVQEGTIQNDQSDTAEQIPEEHPTPQYQPPQ